MEEIYKCHECGQSRTKSFPAYGPTKGQKPGGHCRTCSNDRMEFLERAFAKDNSCQRERDPSQQETRERSTSVPSTGRIEDTLL